MAETVNVFGTTLIEYHRKPNRQPVGVMVAAKVGGTVHYGVSRCDKQDVFSKPTGKFLAHARLQASIDKGRTIKVPSSMQHHFDGFKSRCELYFNNPDPKKQQKHQ